MPPKKAAKKATAATTSHIIEKNETKDETPVEIAESKSPNIEELNRIQAEEIRREANIIQVRFTAATTKEIISKHSGTILANDDPVISLTTLQHEKAAQYFKDNYGSRDILPSNKLADALIFLGYVYDYSKIDIEGLINRKYTELPTELNQQSFLDFLSKFQAPAYNFGQHLRLYCARGQVEKVEELVLRGCNPNTGDGTGLSSLHYAAEFNHAPVITCIAKLLSTSKTNKLNVNTQDRLGWSPLHCAAHHGSFECAKVLIEAGADVSTRASTGKTPLHIAAQQGRTAICDLFISAGASLNVQDKLGMTPLHEAAFRDHERTFNALSKMPQANLTILDSLGNAPSNYLRSFECNVNSLSEDKL